MKRRARWAMRWRRLLCALFFHPDLYVVHQCSPVLCKLFCPRCQRCFGMHLGVHAFGPWSPEFATCDAHD
jgi:hypothetical protein